MENLIKFILAATLAIVFHEGGHYIVARIFGIKIRKVCLFFDPWVKPLFTTGKRFKTEYAIGWIPFGGYTSLDDEYYGRPKLQQLCVQVAGVLTNLASAWAVLYFLAYNDPDFSWARYLGEKRYTDVTMKYIIKVECKSLLFLDAKSEKPQAKQAKNTGRTQKVKETEASKRESEEPATSHQPTKAKQQKYMPLTKRDERDLREIVKQVKEWRRSQTSPVLLWLYDLLNSFCCVSINCALYSMLPIPPLDGGHIVLTGVEAVIRKPLKINFKLILCAAGFAVLVIINILYLIL